MVPQILNSGIDRDGIAETLRRGAVAVPIVRAKICSNKDNKHSCVPERLSVNSTPANIGARTYAAVAAKTSCLRALVKRPRLPAKAIVKQLSIAN